jgi:nucleotide-binding universal stress UspA family protein
MASNGPLLIAFDGSPASIEAVERAAGLMGNDREALILVVWEPGLLNAAVAPIPSPLAQASAAAMRRSAASRVLPPARTSTSTRSSSVRKTR